MPINKFPFIRPSPQSQDLPLLWSKIINPKNGNNLPTLGLVDTGSTYIAIPGLFAAPLGIDLKSGDKEDVQTGGGSTVFYFHECSIDIYNTIDYGNGIYNVVYAIQKKKMAFSEELTFLLLGVSHFLENFTLTINYPNQIFSIRKP